MKLRICVYISFLLLNASGFLSSQSIHSIDEVPWEKCPMLKNSELAAIILDKLSLKNSWTTCLFGKTLYFKNETDLKSELNLFGGRTWFKTEPINDANANTAIRTFRDLELILLDKIGTPVLFHKQGANMSDKTSILLMKRGRIEYRTEWTVKGEKIILLLSGADLSLYVKLSRE
jgi:hypothetical protein